MFFFKKYYLVILLFLLYKIIWITITINNIEWWNSIFYIGLSNSSSFFYLKNILIIKGDFFYLILILTFLPFQKEKSLVLIYFLIGDLLLSNIQVIPIVFITLFSYKKIINIFIKIKLLLLLLLNILIFTILSYYLSLFNIILLCLSNFSILNIFNTIFKTNKFYDNYIIYNYIFSLFLLFYFFFDNSLFTYIIYIILCTRLNLKLLFQLFPLIIKK